MPTDELNKIYENVTKYLNNFKKTPNRVYTTEYILHKQTILESYFKNYFANYTDFVKNKAGDKLVQAVDHRLKFLAKLCELDRLLEEKLPLPTNKNNTNLVMAKFDLALALKIIPEFNGEQNKLTNFLELIRMYKGTIENGEEEKLLDFVAKARLTEKVRRKLAGLVQPKNFKDFESTLRNSFKSKKTNLGLQTELTKLRQCTHKNLTEFIEHIEDLINQINTIQILEQGDKNSEVIRKINDQMALNVFKNGLNEPLKLAIFSARPSTFTEACSLALEVDEPQRMEHKSVFNIRRQNFRSSLAPNFYRPLNRNFNNRSFNNNNGYNAQYRYNRYRQNNQQPAFFARQNARQNYGRQNKPWQQNANNNRNYVNNAPINRKPARRVNFISQSGNDETLVEDLGEGLMTLNLDASEEQ